ncbi:MAG: Hsp20 family protein [Spirochaeta sp.]|nr:Hsp20 family protein [Spirochaeta sp.]
MTVSKYYRRESKVEAELKDGVMSIHLPKRKELKPKQIAISVK